MWPQRKDIMIQPLSHELLQKMHAYWKASNYLSVGQIYLLDNPLLKKPLAKEHIKPRLLGHWGTSPGLNFIYVHLNRIIQNRDLNLTYITGPGHGGPSLVANAWLEGTYSEYYPHVSMDETGMKVLFKQFSFPGGIPSHVAPETPGSMHEGGELGYAVSHAYGAAFDHPDQVIVAVVGDGEAETGPLATSWHSNKFLNPVNDGTVLPILHLNGYKIQNPTVLSRISKEELNALFVGYGYEPHFVEVADPDDYASAHQQMAGVLDSCFDKIKRIRDKALEESKSGKPLSRPRWPMIILRSPKGWTGPKEIDGKKVEGYWRSHQVPFSDMNEAHIAELKKWMLSYQPDALFDESGALKKELQELAPQGIKRMSANPLPHGELGRELNMPDFIAHAVEVKTPGTSTAEATRVMGAFLRDVMLANWDTKNFRLFAPDELLSNRWNSALEASGKAWMADFLPEDTQNDKLAQDGRNMEILSEHTCLGWMEGYLLSGRHGFFSTYEAFAHIIGSMFNQHAKWLKVIREIDWRKPIPSMNILLTSHVWRQDHNGFSHQDPGFIDHVVNKRAEVVRVYLPPDANTLLSVTDHCLRSHNYVNLIVAGKQPALQYLTMDEAIRHCSKGIGIWDWASSDQGGATDVVMACAGDIPTMEALAATSLLRQHVPDLKVRFVNVVDLMCLQSERHHPHGLSDRDFDAIFTTNKPIIFAFHGYPWLVHRLTYNRNGHAHMHVRGYMEEGTTTTPFDMVVLNRMDRYSLAMDVLERVPGLLEKNAHIRQKFSDMHITHKHYIQEHGDDIPEIKNWTWPHN
ncbi:MAG: phosphoketolase family protein [Saezia sp.]